jgi:hypothetical protein
LPSAWQKAMPISYKLILQIPRKLCFAFWYKKEWMVLKLHGYVQQNINPQNAKKKKKEEEISAWNKCEGNAKSAHDKRASNI